MSTLRPSGILRTNRLRVFLLVLYGCGALQFIRFYVRSTSFYLNMPRYLAGQERLPFQTRVFPLLILKPLSSSTWVQQHLAHNSGVFTLERGPFYLLSLVCFAIAAMYVQLLYHVLTANGLLGALVFPVFLLIVMFSYVIHSEANYAYPYDMPSLMFFAAGLFYLYRRQFGALLLVVLVGSFNRETTLFLIALYVLDSATREDAEPGEQPLSGWRGFDLRQVSWARVALLSVVWIAVRAALQHHFRGNDASESFLRVHDNLQQMRPRLLPALLNLCGYTLPIVLVLRGWLKPQRFRNYLWVIPMWFAVMFCSGVLVETRIYGELCSLCAVSLVLILERITQARMGEELAVQEGDDLRSEHWAAVAGLPEEALPVLTTAARLAQGHREAAGPTPSRNDSRAA